VRASLFVSPAGRSGSPFSAAHQLLWLDASRYIYGRGAGGGGRSSWRLVGCLRGGLIA
jgi:hypothetical protein